jgi:flavodoxin
MKACILYFSATGNTKKFAQAISTSLNYPIFNVEDIKPKEIAAYDLLIIGTPVHGLAPAKVISSFIEKLTKVDKKKAIIFSTYAIRKGNANEKLQKQLEKKGYVTILNTSKRGIRFGEEAFEDNIEKIQKIIQSSSET